MSITMLFQTIVWALWLTRFPVENGSGKRNEKASSTAYANYALGFLVDQIYILRRMTDREAGDHKVQGNLTESLSQRVWCGGSLCS